VGLTTFTVNENCLVRKFQNGSLRILRNNNLRTGKLAELEQKVLRRLFKSKKEEVTEGLFLLFCSFFNDAFSVSQTI
jgi:hypothetical protein